MSGASVRLLAGHGQQGTVHATGIRRNGLPKVSMPSTSAASYTAATNQVSSSSQNNGAGFLYDAAGDVTYDGNNEYWYDGVPVNRSSLTGRDAEGQLCAVQSPGSPRIRGPL